MYRFRLAESTDRALLSALQQVDTMKGWIQIGHETDPAILVGGNPANPYLQTIIGTRNGRPAGMACRTVYDRYVNGHVAPVGYLSGLRSFPDARKGFGLARGYAFARKLHQDGRCRYYLSTIMEDNGYAQDMLTGGRAGLPSYRFLERYVTCVFHLPRRPKSGFQCGPIEVRRGGISREELNRFYQELGPKQQFFPVFSKSQWKIGHLANLHPDDFYLAYRDGQLIAAAARWDRRREKRTILRSYIPWLRTVRPLANIALGIAGHHPLPEAGHELSVFYLSYLRVEENDPCICRSLLNAAFHDPANHDFQFFIAGFPSRDPLLEAVRWFPVTRLHSRIYLVYWPEDADAADAIGDNLPVHLEAALL